jgi:hypothetical protein
MKRWLALLLLLASCNGCMLFDEERYYEEPSYMAVAPSPNGCAMPAGVVNVSQTIEPPR